MGAKGSLFRIIMALGLVASLGACAGIKRFAPPGLVKYEDLAGDQPPNPAITARIEEMKAERKGSFPDLKEIPERPEETRAPELREMEAEFLAEAGAELNEKIEMDRKLALEERARADASQ